MMTIVFMFQVDIVHVDHNKLCFILSEPCGHSWIKAQVFSARIMLIAITTLALCTNKTSDISNHRLSCGDNFGDSLCSISHKTLF